MKKVPAVLLLCLLPFLLLKAQSDTLEYRHRPFQFTFMFPPLSTNGIDNVHIINDVSLNLFIGVSGGVEIFEAGSFINVDRFYVNGVQLAGFGNMVGGFVNGFQAAGFMNVAGTYMNGIQAGGFMNLVGGYMNGFQAGGFMNVTGSYMNGFQTAGFLNVTGGKMTGLQTAGFLNIAGASDRGIQAAGFGNVSGGGTTFFQGAGFFNVAERVKGLQAAGFLNVAGHVKGVQLSGFINVCDSIDGVPIGVFSVVKKNGYRKLAFSVSEVQYANLSFRMGVSQFYNIFSFGKPFGPAGRWMYGYGLGTELDLTGKTTLNIEGIVHHEFWIPNPENRYFFYSDRLNLYNSARFLFGWNMENVVSLHVGPTFNVAVAHTRPDLSTRAWHEIPPYSVFDRTADNYRQTNVQIWFGLTGEVRF